MQWWPEGVGEAHDHVEYRCVQRVIRLHVGEVENPGVPQRFERGRHVGCVKIMAIGDGNRA